MPKCFISDGVYNLSAFLDFTLPLFVQFYTNKVLTCKTIKQGFYLFYPPSNVNMRIKWNCSFSKYFLTLQMQSIFHFIQNVVIWITIRPYIIKVSVYYAMCEDWNITKMYFKNYKNTNYPQMVPTEQFLEGSTVTCLKIRWKYISKFLQIWLNDKIKTLCS